MTQSASLPEVRPEVAAPSGRDHRGRFTKGNKGGPGNPFARRVAALRQALLETVTEEDLRVVAAQLVEQARAGDLAAAKLLLAYAVGRPAETVDPDTLDVQEWDLFRQSQARAQEVAGVLGQIPAHLACVIARATLPGIEQGMVDQLARALADEPAGARGEGSGAGCANGRHRQQTDSDGGWKLSRSEGPSPEVRDQDSTRSLDTAMLAKGAIIRNTQSEEDLPLREATDSITT